MKVQVRRGCFETNSSSQHCIAIVKPENVKRNPDESYGWQLTADWLKPNADVKVNEEIVIGDDSIVFERWPFRVLTTMFQKAQYAIASYGTEEMFYKISDICKDVTGHGLKVPLQRKWKAFIDTDLEEGEEIPQDRFIPEWEIAYDKEKEEFYRIVDGEKRYDVSRDCFREPFFGYVDHQSAGLLQGFLKKHSISLDEFLTNPQYIVVIDGDEYCMWNQMFESGLCLKENFVETGIYDYDHPTDK